MRNKKQTPQQLVARYTALTLACQERVAERIELTALLKAACEPERRGWIGRVSAMFAEQGDAPPSERTLGDDAKIYELLREQMGLSQQDLAGFAYGRMRLFAQNREWALQNRERVLEALRSPEGSEEKLRAMIGAEEGRRPEAVLPVRRFRLKPAAIKAVDSALEQAEESLKAAGKRVPKNRDELLVTIVREWRQLKGL